ncbi:MAG TPA: CehA/McbA family metallohydrolase [Acidobacteriota bacterium]|nr:CehA/McbA family metallohydrolase [Acidobacteriota bacterium]
MLTNRPPAKGTSNIFLTIVLILTLSPGRDSPASPKCRLQVRTFDGAGNHVVPARVYLNAADGALQVPSGSIVYQKNGENHFVTQGEFSIDLPPGSYALKVERGPEYRPWSTSLQLSEGEDRRIDARLERWISMNRLGWYSGDLHNHRRIEEMPALLLAEDLNLAPTLTDWIWEDKPISTPPPADNAIRSVDATHVFSVLDKEVERLEWGPGAVDLLGLRTVIPFQGDRLSPPNDTFCSLAHKQGGYVDAEKIVWRDGAALAALGHLDFAGIVHNHFNRQGVELKTEEWGMIPRERAEYRTVAGMPLWSMDVYYRLLNCGFRIAVSAGSASGVKASPLGYNRVYAKVDGPFTYERWFHALKAGRSFGTNGPMLFLQVDGQEAGSILRIQAAATRSLNVHAECRAIGSLDRLEIVFKGRVLKTVRNTDPRGRIATDFKITPQESGWIAARCFENPSATVRFAHTSPTYIALDNKSPVVASDAQYMVDWIDREMEFYRKEARFRRPEDRDAMLAFFGKARRVYADLAIR